MKELHFNGKLSHAYVVASVSRELRESTAKRLAAAMLCIGPGEKPCGECRHCRKTFSDIHPDIISVERESDGKGKKKRELSVDIIRKVVADASIMPNEADKKVYIIFDADTMNMSAQNAMLKLLEEPPGGACFILCAENAGLLLDTVRSRCAEIIMNAGDAEPGEMGEDAEKYLQLAASGDRAELVRFIFALEKLNQDSVVAFTDEVFRLIVKQLADSSENMEPDKLIKLAALMKKARKYLRANTGVKHVIGLLAAKTI